MKLSKQILEAAERVERKSREVYEDVVLGLLEDIMQYALIYISYTVATWPELLDKLIEKGLENPSEEDILETIEEMSSYINVDNSFKSAPEPLKTIIIGGLIAAKRIGKKEWFEKMSYEKVLELSRKRGLKKVEELLIKYPNTCRKIIDWMRSKLVDS